VSGGKDRNEFRFPKKLKEKKITGDLEITGD